MKAELIEEIGFVFEPIHRCRRHGTGPKPPQIEELVVATLQARACTRTDSDRLSSET
jgi:hypothetical protein